jgi:hypothetical protein
MLLRPPLFDCRQNIRHDFVLGFTQTGSTQKSDCDKKNIVILDGTEEE